MPWLPQYNVELIYVSGIYLFELKQVNGTRDKTANWKKNMFHILLE